MASGNSNLIVLHHEELYNSATLTMNLAEESHLWGSLCIVSVNSLENGENESRFFGNELKKASATRGCKNGPSFPKN
jgi:hypothetical protein